MSPSLTPLFSPVLIPLLALSCTLMACAPLEPPDQSQPLLVGLPDDPVLQSGRATDRRMRGYSRDLASLFAAELDVPVRYVRAKNYKDLMNMARVGQVHLVTGIRVYEGDPLLRYSPPLRLSQQLLVRHEKSSFLQKPAKKKAEATDTVNTGIALKIPYGAPHQSAYHGLTEVPLPPLTEQQDVSEIALLAEVANSTEMVVASDDLHYDMAKKLHPELEIAYELPGKLAYVWAVNAKFQQLHDRLIRFIETAKENGTLQRIEDRYFGHMDRLQEQDIKGFHQNILSRLPHYREYFYQAQKDTGLDWRLLAALAYQESQWDPLATSRTGVRGMMMLTEDTARRMGIKNRLDPQQSIHAGSKYLSRMYSHLPKEIQPPDRLWFALAAYNLGLGHLRGARHFAPGLKRNANSWFDMKEVLPLMSRPEYYKRLKSGRARGGEAVILVERVRNFYDILLKLEAPYKPGKKSAVVKKKAATTAN